MSSKGKSTSASKTRLDRTTFQTSRLLDFCSRKELIAQTGHQPDAWPLVALKELVDNALDACEDAGAAPVVSVTVGDRGITVTDNGPGIPSETIVGVLDFAVRVSNREAYVAPDRGAQGNALKTIVAMPFVLDGQRGEIEIASQGVRHRITMQVDRIRQEPVIDHARKSIENGKDGTTVTVRWPDSASSILTSAKGRFLQFAEDYAWLNPHLTLTVDWFGESTQVAATAPNWMKWRPSDPTCPHWYGSEHFERLIAAYVAHDEGLGVDRTVRDVVREFRGLTGSGKQKQVLDATGLARTHLSELRNGDGLDSESLGSLLAAMKANTRAVKPAALGVIGKQHLRERYEAAGCEMDSFQYHKVLHTTDDIPWVLETAFGWCPDAEARRLISGVNWSAGIINPFRELGKFGRSLDTILTEQRADEDEPVILVIHVACPRVEYTDRGKSAVVVS